MGDAHRRSHFVDVLTARAPRMINIDADIVVLDLYLVVVLDLGHDFERTKGGVAALIGVERGDANQTVHPHLRFQIAVGVFALDAEIDALDARFVARFPIEFKDLESHFFAVSRIHPIQHGAPVAGLCAARARVQGKKRVVRIVRSLQNGADTHILDIFIRRLQHSVKLPDQAFVARFLDEVDDLLRVGERRFALRIGADLIFDVRDFPADFGGLFEILPYVRLFLFPFEFAKARALIFEVQRIARFL